VPRKAPAVEHLRAYLQHQFAALLGSDPRARRGDDEGVHGMRVASRRMRSVLKEAERLLEPSWVRETRDELKWLGGVLGEVRDPDVFCAYVESEARGLSEAAAEGGADLVALIRSRSEASRRRLMEALDSPRYLALLDRLDATAESLPVSSAHESLATLLGRAARRTRSKLRGVSARSAADAELHELRIAAKRARYAGELAETVAGSAARRLARRAAAVQKILGEHQDAVVAEERLEGLAVEATPAAAFVAGRLAERQRDRRARARAKLPRAADRLERAARKL
jgi:CHAD domain-containing protein